MKREASPPRPDFAAEAASIGFEFPFDDDGEPYWDESVRYVFTRSEVEGQLEKAAADLHALCLELVGRVVESDALLTRLRIPRQLGGRSPKAGDAAILGFMDASISPTAPAGRQNCSNTTRTRRRACSRRRSFSGDGSNN
jgi:Glutathionylspermidine synthase preATP-grasp